MLQQEVYNLLGGNEVKFWYHLMCIYHCSGPDLLLFSLGLHKHIDTLEGEKAILKQQAEELQKKLEAAEECRTAVEEKLTEGAITAIENVVGVIKSR